MTAIPPGLTVREAQILELFRGGADRDRVIRVGHHRRSWTERDVDDVWATHIAPPDSAQHVTWRPQPYAGIAQQVILTRRQGEILEALCDGMSNRQIAAVCQCSEDTVKSHVKAVMGLLHAEDRTHAVILALTGRVRVLIPSPKQQRRTA